MCVLGEGQDLCFRGFGVQIGCVGEGVNGLSVLGVRVRELTVFWENQIWSWGITACLCVGGGGDLEHSLRRSGL